MPVTGTKTTTSMNKQSTFRKGRIVANDRVALLVTGKGDRSAPFPTFAGVVVWAKYKESEGGFPIGTHSRAWSSDAVALTNLKVADVIRIALDQLNHDHETVLEFLRGSWRIQAAQIRNLGINPDMPVQDLTLRELGRLSDFLDTRISDIVNC